jgi:hypothetical protein
VDVSATAVIARFDKPGVKVAEAVAAVDGKSVLRQQRTATIGQGIVAV